MQLLTGVSTLPVALSTDPVAFVPEESVVVQLLITARIEDSCDEHATPDPPPLLPRRAASTG